jgi:outer membrane protein assembly factor BamB
MNIKVQCPCGAKYSFEVEPVDGRMPFPVNCPTCQADGTEAANQLIAEALAAEGGVQPRLRVQVADLVPAVEVPRHFPQTPAGARLKTMERLQKERRQWRLTGWLLAGAGLLLVACLGGWGWFAFIGSKPQLAWHVKVPGAGSAWHAQFLDAKTVLLVSSSRALARDLATDREVWSTALSETASGEEPGAAPPVFLDKENIWICLETRVLRLQRGSGKLQQAIPIAGHLQSFTPAAGSILVVSAKDETTRLAMQIDLSSREAQTQEIVVPRTQTHAMPNELPPNVQPTAGVLLSQALEEQKFNKPLTAVSSEFFSAGENLVELRVRLVQPKVTWVQSIKPRGPSHINGSTSTSTSVADVEEEVFNDIKRSQTGGAKSIDESRYEVQLRRWLGAAPALWTGEVTGLPLFFPLKTVDLLVAGAHLAVFDKQNKELFEAKLSYPVSDRFQPEHWDRRSAPAVEGGSVLYFFDKGVLTAFSLPAGEVRWRLTSIGISKIQFDGQGLLYVDSSTAAPEDIQYSDQLSLEKAAPVLLKVDPRSGIIQWQAQRLGQDCFVSGQFLYTASTQQGGIALANGLAEALNAPRPEGPVYFRIYRLDPATGKVLWEFYREEAPGDLSFQQNRFLLRFGNDVQLWKFLTF